jgi:hypothetical protein
MARTAQKSVDKLYAQLPPQKQALLVFEAIAKGDSKHADYIENHVEVRDYRCRHKAYMRQLDALNNLASLYGVTWWQIKCELMQSLGTLSANEEDGDIAKAVQDNLSHWLALDKALEQVCEAKGIDVGCVRTLHHCHKVAIPDFAPDEGQIAEYVAKYVTMFNRAFLF